MKAHEILEGIAWALAHGNAREAMIRAERAGLSIVEGVVDSCIAKVQVGNATFSLVGA